MSTAPTADEIQAWSPTEQDRVRRALDGLVARPTGAARRPRRRIVLLAVTAVGAMVLLPWIVVLSATLPMTTSVGAWRLAWVGFDVALTVGLALSAWSVWRRRQLALIALAVTATLVACDMWFDVCLSWGTDEQGVAVVTALVVELPLLVILVVGGVDHVPAHRQDHPAAPGHGWRRTTAVASAARDDPARAFGPVAGSRTVEYTPWGIR